MHQIHAETTRQKKRTNSREQTRLRFNHLRLSLTQRSQLIEERSLLRGHKFRNNHLELNKVIAYAPEFTWGSPRPLIRSF